MNYFTPPYYFRFLLLINYLNAPSEICPKTKEEKVGRLVLKVRYQPLFSNPFQFGLKLTIPLGIIHLSPFIEYTVPSPG